MESTQSYPYSFLITNAQTYLRATTAEENGGLDAFRISEVLAVLLGKTKEDVLADIVETPAEDPHEYKRKVVAYLKNLGGEGRLRTDIIEGCGGTRTECLLTLRALWNCGEVTASGTAHNTQYYWTRDMRGDDVPEGQTFNCNIKKLAPEGAWDLSPDPATER